MELTLFTKYQQPIKSRDTERGNLMKEFMEILNLGRVGTAYKPLSMPRMGVILEKIPTDSLYTLLSKCKESGENAKNKRKFATELEKKKLDTYESAFSKKFYFEIRPKKNEALLKIAKQSKTSKER